MSRAKKRSAFSRHVWTINLSIQLQRHRTVVENLATSTEYNTIQQSKNIRPYLPRPMPDLVLPNENLAPIRSNIYAPNQKPSPKSDNLAERVKRVKRGIRDLN
jgi:hypothetical protein